jgi:hypothetical protein
MLDTSADIADLQQAGQELADMLFGAPAPGCAPALHASLS